MKRAFFLSAALALVALLLPGCPGNPPVKPLGELSVNRSSPAWESRAASLKTLSATLAMQVKLSGMSSTENLSASFNAAGPPPFVFVPDMALVDYKVLDLGCDSSTWWVHFQGQDTDRIDYGSLRDLDRTNQDIPLRPDQVVAILGMTPIRDTASSYLGSLTPITASTSFRRSSPTTALSSSPPASPSTPPPISSPVTKPSSPMAASICLATIEKYQVVSNVSVPKTIHIRLFSQKDEGRLDLDFSNVKVNPVIPDRMFVLPDFSSVKQQFRHPLERHADVRHRSLPLS